MNWSLCVSVEALFFSQAIYTAVYRGLRLWPTGRRAKKQSKGNLVVLYGLRKGRHRRVRCRHLNESSNFKVFWSRRYIYRSISRLQRLQGRHRADHISDATCPNCGSTNLTAPRAFNLMFKTNVGPIDDGSSYAFYDLRQPNQFSQILKMSLILPQEITLRDSPNRQIIQK